MLLLLTLLVAADPANPLDETANAAATANTATRPNIVVILADDLGYSDLGCYGGEIATPHLDTLAATGVRFRSFHNTGRCWPTRAALLTGYYPQSVRRDTVDGVRSGGRGERPEWAPLIARPLGDAGYRCYHSGKWHVDGMPVAEGFDRSYYLKDQSRFFSPTKHWLDDQPLPPVQRGTDFYATDTVAQYAVDFLAEHARETPDQPFFCYLAFAAPHFPLHARPQDIARYRGRYAAGWDAVRQQRIDALAAVGWGSQTAAVPLRKVGSPYGFVDQIAQFGPGEFDAYRPWDTLTEQQQAFQAAKMEVHAAMVDRMDQQIGRVMEQISRTGDAANTLVLFLSDNGASAELMVRGDGHDPAAAAGSADTHLCLGPGWSTTANTPFAYHKTWTHQGGIATPLLVNWPAGDLPGIGGWTDQVGHAIDLWPTLLTAANISLETASPHDRPGRSLWPLDQTPERQLWWSHEENRAYRDGRWKIVSARADRSERGDGAWELYDLAVDPAETRDLAGQHPGRVEVMAKKWDQLDERHAGMARGDERRGTRD